MKERVVIIFIAVTLGLLATTIGFFLYESSKPNREINAPVLKNKKPAPIVRQDITLTLTSPKDESVTANRTIQVKGVTDAQNTIIISTNQEDVAVTPTSQGNFSATVSIDAGENKLFVEAIDPSGNSKKITQTVSFSSDEF